MAAETGKIPRAGAQVVFCYAAKRRSSDERDHLGGDRDDGGREGGRGEERRAEGGK